MLTTGELSLQVATFCFVHYRKFRTLGRNIATFLCLVQQKNLPVTDDSVVINISNIPQCTLPPHFPSLFLFWGEGLGMRLFPSVLLSVYGTASSKSWWESGRLALCNICHLQCKFPSASAKCCRDLGKRPLVGNT